MYPRPQKRFPVGRKYVTIAAGFVCQDGIVLCADTEETGVGYKRRVVKLQIMPNKPPFSEDEPVAIFTGSGDAAFVDEVIEEMWNGVLESGEQELSKIIKRLQYENRRYHTTIYHCYPPATRPELLPAADLLFAVRAKDGFGLFRAYGTRFTRVRRYASIGCGAELADYICDEAQTIWTVRAVPLAVYMLNRVKDHVPGCGGDSHIAILTRDGEAQTLSLREILGLEEQFLTSEQITKEILVTCANRAISDEAFDKFMRAYAKQLLAIRKKRRQQDEKLEKLVMKAVQKGLSSRSRSQKSAGQR